MVRYQLLSYIFHSVDEVEGDVYVDSHESGYHDEDKQQPR